MRQAGHKPGWQVHPNDEESVNAYEQKQEERRERLQNAAERQDEEATRRFNAAHAAVAGIPFGQPILVDHHSAPRHRAALRRQDTNMRKGSEAYKLAQELRGRAEAVGTGGISSDDPDAVDKLQAELDGLQAEHERDKAANQHYRTGDDAALLAVTGKTRAEWDAEIVRFHYYPKQPAPGYRLSNRNANMKRIRQRIAELEQLASAPLAADVVIGEVTISDDATENRVMIRFPKALEHVRAAIKSRGWKWSPTRTAWVRQRGPGIMALATTLVQNARPALPGITEENGTP